MIFSMLKVPRKHFHAESPKQDENFRSLFFEKGTKFHGMWNLLKIRAQSDLKNAPSAEKSDWECL